MRDVALALLILMLIGLEVALWITNPMHISASFLPARAFGVEMFRELQTPTSSAAANLRSAFT